jgi:hypothetical protein
MSTVKADKALGVLLSELKDVTQIQDTNGEVLGYFTPRAQLDAQAYERAPDLFDPVETQRRKQAEHGKGLVLEEVMRRLHSLGTAE